MPAVCPKPSSPSIGHYAQKVDRAVPQNELYEAHFLACLTVLGPRLGDGNHEDKKFGDDERNTTNDSDCGGS